MNQESTISVCLGSSCFSRNNKATIEVIKTFIKKYNLNTQIFFHGDLCSGNCENGPIIKIDDQLFTHITPLNVAEILNNYFMTDEAN
jgi:NADH:ubiquinone oxidoreductase subunit E